MELKIDMDNKCIRIDGELWHLYKKPFPNKPTDFTNKESVDRFIRECAPSVAEWIINNSKPTKESIDVPLSEKLFKKYGTSNQREVIKLMQAELDSQPLEATVSAGSKVLIGHLPAPESPVSEKLQATIGKDYAKDRKEEAENEWWKKCHPKDKITFHIDHNPDDWEVEVKDSCYTLTRKKTVEAPKHEEEKITKEDLYKMFKPAFDYFGINPLDKFK